MKPGTNPAWRAWRAPPALPLLSAAGLFALVAGGALLSGRYLQAGPLAGLFAGSRPSHQATRPALPPPSAKAGVPAAESASPPRLVTLDESSTFKFRSAASYARFKAWVDAALAGNPGYDFQPGDAALLARINGDPRYCELAVRLVDGMVAAAEADIGAGRLPPAARDSYLNVGSVVANIAQAWAYCQPQTSAAQRTRWSAHAQQAVWNVWNPQQARWGGVARPWSGWSIDNPGNNYHFSFLKATMYWALASGDQGWYSHLRDRKLPALVAYYARLPGGGSREGTGYGTAHKNLFDLYRVWNDSTNQDLANASPHAGDTILYWIHATVPTMDRFAPIGDQARNSVPELFDYHRHLVLSARATSHSPPLQAAASWWLERTSVPAMTQGSNRRYDMLPAGSSSTPPAALFHHATGTGHLFARTGWSSDAMWLAYVAGPYDESHAHQDQGSFTLFAGDWLAVTQNIWTRSGIQQGTAVHNLVRFERPDPQSPQCQAPAGDRIVHQCTGAPTMQITRGSGSALTINSDLSAVHAGNPAVRSWTRRLEFSGRRLLVRDVFSLGPGASAYFQLNVPVQPQVNGREATAGRLRMRVLEPAGATLQVHNWRGVNASEHLRGWRIDVAGGSSGYLVELTET